MMQEAAKPDPALYWVNHGETFADSVRLNCVWAPLERDGPDLMRSLKAGDVLVHYSDNRIRAFSKVRGSPYAAACPFPRSEAPNGAGRRVDVDYAQLHPTIDFRMVKDAIRRESLPQNPIDEDGSVRAGVLFSFSLAALRRVRFSTTTPFPQWVEATFDMRDRRAGAGAVTISDYQALYGTLQEGGLYFSAETLSNYILALQTKRFVILTGISGTGKTQMATALAHYLQPLVAVRVMRSHERGREMVVQEYMKRSQKLVLPSTFVAEIRLPPLDDVSAGRKMTAFYGNATTRLSVYKHPTQNVVQLMLGGQFWEWFDQMQVGDPFLVEAIETGEANPHALRFSTVATASALTEEKPLDNQIVIAVRPDWTDNRGLVGYYNPLLERYVSTPLLRVLLNAQEDMTRAEAEGREPHPFFVILDEMNLARVEHYFSDFLSCMESGEPLHVHDNPLLEAGESEDNVAVPRRLRIPDNVYFTGTVNADETTFMFSPKVIDRAFTIELNEVDLQAAATVGRRKLAAETLLGLHNWPGTLTRWLKPSSRDWKQLGTLLDGQLQRIVLKLQRILAAENRHFGYRVANEIARFVCLAAEQIGKDEKVLWAVTDMALLQKVLPKMHGTQQELATVLTELFSFAVDPEGSRHGGGVDEYELRESNLVPVDTHVPDPRLPRLAAKIWRMQRRLRQQGFTSFIE